MYSLYAFFVPELEIISNWLKYHTFFSFSSTWALEWRL